MFKLVLLAFHSIVQTFLAPSWIDIEKKIFLKPNEMA